MVVMGNPLGDVNCVLKLVQAGVDLKLKDDQGWNCLHWAAYHSNVAAIEILLEKYDALAVMSLLVDKNNDGLTPLELATKENQDDFVAWVRTAVKQIYVIELICRDEIEVLHDLEKKVDEDVEKLLLPLLEDKQ